MARRTYSQNRPLRRPTKAQMRVAGERCKGRAHDASEAQPLTWMELGTLLETSDAFRAIDVIWQADTVGYPGGGDASSGGGGSSSSTERAALDRMEVELSRKKLRKRTDPAAISLKIIALLLDATKPDAPASRLERIDHNQARTLVIGIRSATHHDGRTEIPCPNCSIGVIPANSSRCSNTKCNSHRSTRTVCSVEGCDRILVPGATGKAKPCRSRVDGQLICKMHRDREDRDAKPAVAVEYL